MNYKQRSAEVYIREFMHAFPVVAVVGARQTGKTTFLRHEFPKYTYVNLEDPHTLNIATADPRAFLRQHSNGLIIDEVQRFPELFSYIQTFVDERKHMGNIIISGSQNLLISERIAQSLAGRVAYQHLFPFTQTEIEKGLASDRYEAMLTGGYPALFVRDIAPFSYFQQYIATYVERDVRMFRNIQDLALFRRFLMLCAGRVGQVLNVSSLANDTGISPNTAESWISLLEASFLVFRLQPHAVNVGKRVVKSPKLYFTDTGLLCALLNVSSVRELNTHYLAGAIFENYIIEEIRREIATRHLSASIFYYRDKKGNEIDLLVDTGTTRIPIEIKLSETFTPAFQKGLSHWRKHIDPSASGYIVYGGTGTQTLENDTLVGWNALDVIHKRIK